MTKIKLCGLSRLCDIEAANKLRPEYIGIVFAPKSHRYVTPEKAAELKKLLHPDIAAVGVFVNDDPETVSELLNGTIDIAQLHGNETEDYIKRLRTLTDQPIIKAFRINTEQDVTNAQNSSADYILLDSGCGGTGTAFDWKLVQNVKRPYFLAGGLDSDNVRNAIKTLNPYAVDVSSGIEADGLKNTAKMREFVCAVRRM